MEYFSRYLYPRTLKSQSPFLSPDGLFRLLTYLLTGIGFAMLALARQWSIWAIILFTVPYLLALTRRFGRNPRLTIRQAKFLTWLYLLFFGLDLFYLSRSFVQAALHLILFVQLVKIYQPKKDRDYFHLILLSFLEVLAASSLTIDLSFLLFFLLYAFLCIWCLMLFQFRRAQQTAGPIFPPGKDDSEKTFQAETWRGADRRAKQVIFAMGFVGALILISATFVGTALFFCLPRFGAGYFSRSVRPSSVLSGFSDHIRLGAIGTIQLDSSVVMRIRLVGTGSAPPEVKWRGITLDYFDGKSWLKSPLRRTLPLQGQNEYWLSQSQQTAPSLRYQVLLEPSSSGYLFTLNRTRRLKTTFSPVFWDPADNSLSGPPHPFRRVAYEAECAVSESVPASGLNRLTDQEQHRYLQLPSLDSRVARLAREISYEAASELDLARKVEEYLRSHYRYSLEEAQILHPQPLESFLFETKRGHCEYFATAMVVLLRHLGVPSRIVNGFRGGEYNEISGDLVVRARAAHSWVEIFTPRDGWSSFDPTPPSLDEARSASVFRTIDNYLDALDLFWAEWILGYDSQGQASLFKGLQESANDWAAASQDFLFHISKALGRKFGHFVQLPEKRPGFIRMFQAMAVLVAGSLALLVWFEWRRRRKPNGKQTVNDQEATAIQLYASFLRVLGHRNRTKAEYLTPNEFAATFSQEKIGPQVREITSIYNRLRYGSEGPGQELVQRAAVLLHEIQKG
ncbi:MAG: DUF3488 and transglutaminase-like domain-containing protein [Terriglobia bacterium]